MTALLPLPPEPGTPVERVDPAFSHQETRAFRPGLDCSRGAHLVVAQLVANTTGDHIAWPFGTVTFVDREQRMLAVVLHEYVAANDSVTLSVDLLGLRLTRAVLEGLASFVVDDLRPRLVLVRVPVADLARRDIFRRLGFRRVASFVSPTPAHLFALDVTNPPPFLRRLLRFMRRAH